MTDRILALLAFLTLLGFLGVLVGFVPRLDLGLVVGATLLLVIYDFFATLFRAPSGDEDA